MMFVRFIVKKMSKGMFNAGQMDVNLIREKLAKAYAEPIVTGKQIGRAHV